MSAKHKRPFYVFAAVAAVCCLVLVTGYSGADPSPGSETGKKELAADDISDGHRPIAPLVAMQKKLTLEAVLADTAGGAGDESESGPSSTGGTEPPRSTPDADETGDPPVPGSDAIDGDPPPSDTDDTDDPVDEGDSPPVATRPPGEEEDQAGPPPADEETEQEADSDGDPDGDEEEPGPLDETEDPDGTDDPSDEGAGMDTDEAPDEAPDEGQGEDQN